MTRALLALLALAAVLPAPAAACAMRYEPPVIVQAPTNAPQPQLADLMAEIDAPAAAPVAPAQTAPAAAQPAPAPVAPAAPAAPPTTAPRS